MITQKRCVKCGYANFDGKDIVCPVCGGRMSETQTRVCDERIEKQWNGGYHNDFMEKRKTGDYCDPKLEKEYNDGRHYHNQKTSGNIYGQLHNALENADNGKNINDIGFGKLHDIKEKKTDPDEVSAAYKLVVFIIVMAVGFAFMGFGFIMDFLILRSSIKKKQDGAEKRFLSKVSILCLILFIVTLAVMFGKEIFPEISYIFSDRWFI